MGRARAADLVSDLLPDLLPLRFHAGVFGLALFLLLSQGLLPLLLLLLCVWVLLLLSPQHLPHVLGGPYRSVEWSGRKRAWSGTGKAGGSRVRGRELTSEGLLHDEVHPAGFD